MFGWLRGGKAAPTEISPELWREATHDWLFMRGLTPAEGERLRAISGDFLAGKHFSGTHELEISDRMQVEIAAQACILVLEIGLEWYDGWSEVIVYPSQFAPEREEVDEAGVVHLTQDPMAGEAWLGGPVVLSYEDVARTGDPINGIEGYNVVIHEFAHKLDMLNGEANGFPPLQKGMHRDAWKQAFMAAYLAFCRAVDAADAIEHRDGGRALDALPLDPYASESPAEFFAVISEAFFEIPDVVVESFPAVYAQLVLFYRQDPRTRHRPSV